jgi:hypothetical protein
LRRDCLFFGFGGPFSISFITARCCRRATAMAALIHHAAALLAALKNKLRGEPLMAKLHSKEMSEQALSFHIAGSEVSFEDLDSWLSAKPAS